MALLLSGCLVGACSGADEPRPARPPAVAGTDLDASIAQFRFDEGTHRLRAGVVNQSHRDVRVTRAQVQWAGFAFPAVPLPDDPVHPGQAAAFPVEYGDARCDDPVAVRRAPARLVVVVDGRSRTLPLRVEDPGLLRRLHAVACQRQRLDATATVRLVLGKARAGHTRDDARVPARLELTRVPGGAQDAVTVVDLGGSVLIDLVPRAGADVLPTDLAAGRPRLVVPVWLGSSGRCDAHALGQSSQTFLLSAYVRLDGRTQRVVLPLSADDRAKLTTAIHRGCAAS